MLAAGFGGGLNLDIQNFGTAAKEMMPNGKQNGDAKHNGDRGNGDNSANHHQNGVHTDNDDNGSPAKTDKGKTPKKHKAQHPLTFIRIYAF